MSWGSELQNTREPEKPDHDREEAQDPLISGRFPLKSLVGSNETVIQAIPSSNNQKFMNQFDIKPFDRAAHPLTKNQ
jgi:hypothetical protein